MKTGWLYRAMNPLLPNWAPEEMGVVRLGTVKGIPDPDNDDPRISARQYARPVSTTGPDEITIAMMVGTERGAGKWIESDYTPEQAIQIVAAILSCPAMEEVVGPLLEALNNDH